MASANHGVAEKESAGDASASFQTISLSEVAPIRRPPLRPLREEVQPPSDLTVDPNATPLPRRLNLPAPPSVAESSSPYESISSVMAGLDATMASEPESPPLRRTAPADERTMASEPEIAVPPRPTRDDATLAQEDTTPARSERAVDATMAQDQPLSPSPMATDVEATMASEPEIAAPPLRLVDVDATCASEPEMVVPNTEHTIDDPSVVPGPGDAIRTMGSAEWVPETSDPDVYPRRFGPYILDKKLAEGGMGAVYLARHTQLRRTVALKTLLSGENASKVEISRFLTEAAASAKLNHPNIVQVFDIGEARGQHYFAMEFVAGGSLKDILDEGVLAPAAVAKIMEPVCRALGAAHRVGIVHRDLKPHNIMLRVDGDTLRRHGGAAKAFKANVDAFTPLVADFGLAKNQEEEQDRTRSGAILGTPAYMPPEQARGGTKHLTPAADIYSLGATLYALLAGRPPFQAATVFETIHAVVNADAPALRTLNPAVPVELETICHKCLEKDPARRYLTADDLADDLAKFARGKPIAARPLSGREKAWRWVLRHPLRATLYAFGGLAALGATGGAVVYQRFSYALEVSQMRSEQERETERMRAKAVRDEAETKLANALATATAALDKHDNRSAREALGVAKGLLSAEGLEQFQSRHAALAARLQDADDTEQALREFEPLRRNAESAEAPSWVGARQVTAADRRQSIEAALKKLKVADLPDDQLHRFRIRDLKSIPESRRTAVRAACRSLLLELAQTLPDPARKAVAEESAANLRGAEGNDTDRANALISDSRRLLREGKLREALDKATDAHRLAPNEPTALVLRAVPSMVIDRPIDAVTVLDAAMGLADDKRWLLLLRGVARAQLGQRHEGREASDTRPPPFKQDIDWDRLAERDLERAVELGLPEPGEFAARAHRAMIRVSIASDERTNDQVALAKLGAAKEDIDWVVLHDPTNPIGQHPLHRYHAQMAARGPAAERARHWEQALLAATRAARQSSHNRAFYQQELAHLLGQLDRHREAADAFRESARLSVAPADAARRLLLAVLYYGKANDMAAAIRAAREATEKQPKALRPKYALAFLISQLGEPDAALAELDKAFTGPRSTSADDAPIWPLAWQLRATLCNRLKKFSDAIEAYGQAIALAPRDPGFLIERGGLHLSLQPPSAELAELDAELALRLKPDSMEALGLRALARALQGRPDAVKDADAVVAQATDAKSLFRSAQAYAAALEAIVSPTAGAPIRRADWPPPKQLLDRAADALARHRERLSPAETAALEARVKADPFLGRRIGAAAVADAIRGARRPEKPAEPHPPIEGPRAPDGSGKG